MLNSEDTQFARISGHVKMRLAPWLATFIIVVAVVSGGLTLDYEPPAMEASHNGVVHEVAGPLVSSHHIERMKNHRSRINDKVLDHQLEAQQKARREKLQSAFKERSAEKHMKNPLRRRKWSEFEGVTIASLDVARNRTVRNQITSCAELIRRHFEGDSLPTPLRSAAGSSNGSENTFRRRQLLSGPSARAADQTRPLVFLHIPKNAGTAIEHVTMDALDKLAARHPHFHAEEWASARKGVEDSAGRVHIGGSVSIKVPVEAGTIHPAMNDTCKCSVS